MYIQKNTPLPPFVPLPKFILQTELSLNAKLLYGLLLNRAMLSQKNDWTDEQGRVFVIYTIRRMAQDLDRSERTVKNALRELDAAGLLQRVRQGFQQANRIFVLLPELFPPLGQEAAPEKCSIYPPEVQEAAPQAVQKLPPNKTEEYNNPSKTERVPLPPLGHYKNVFLTKQQLEGLRQEFPGRSEDCIERLSAYMARTGRTYASHEAVLRHWLTQDRPNGGIYTDADYLEGGCL